MISNNFSVLKISRFGLISTVLFLMFTIIARLVLPFGDEPDFIVRAPNLIDKGFSWVSPYNYLMVKTLNYNSNCNIHGSVTSIWFQIDSYTCKENEWQILHRIFIIFFVSLPIFFMIVFRNLNYKILRFFPNKVAYEEFNRRLDALSICILFPSFLYFVGVMAEEQWVLVLATIVVIFVDIIPISLFLLFLIFTIDIGNFLVVATFFLLSNFFHKVYKERGEKFLNFYSLIIITSAALLNTQLFNILNRIPFLESKVSSILDKKMGFIDKYPIYFRPVISFITGVFMTPSGIKSLFLFLIVLIFSIVISRKVFVKNYNFYTDRVAIKSAVTTILFFVLLLPDYAYAKYYVFMLPVFFIPFVRNYSRNKVLFISAFTTLVWAINMLTYWS